MPRLRKVVINLARFLNSNSFNVIRFDYYGTGLSYGSYHELNLEQIKNDGKEVLNYIKGRNCKKIISIGIRFGGFLSITLQEPKKEFDKIILIEPITNLKNYINEMISGIRINELLSYGKIVHNKEYFINQLNKGQNIFIDGYEISSDLYYQFINENEIDLVNIINNNKNVFLFSKERKYQSEKFYLIKDHFAWQNIRFLEPKPTQLFKDILNIALL